MISIAFKERLNIFALDHSDKHILKLPWAVISGENLYDSEAVAVISDADIYNFRELCTLVGDEAHDPAHLIGLFYLKYGLATFEKIRGAFSICIVDKRNEKLIVATDRFGIKPVVYYADEKKFISGARIKSILSVQPDLNEFDHRALIDYMNLSAIPTPKTIYRKIKKLPPGYFMVIAREKMSPVLSKYYDIEYKDERKGEDHFYENIPRYIEESVKTILDHEHARGHRTGAFLSGGTDSSTVSGMIKKLTGSVKTFSIGFDEPGYNELGYARIAAKSFGAEHHEYRVTPDDVLKALDIITDAYDEPFGNSSAVPTYYCAALAKKHGVDTLLAGDGGDEIFGGNERYASDFIFRVYHRIPSCVRKGLLEPFMSVVPEGISFFEKGGKYIRRANIPHPDRFFSYHPVMALGKEAIFSPDFLNGLNGYDAVSWARELYANVRNTDELNRLLYIDLKFTITDNDLRKVTVTSERAGIHVAYPLLDHHIVDFAATMPAELKVKGTYLRYGFKKALKDFLPREIIKKKKHGFGLPIGVWIRTKKNISSFVRDTLLSSNSAIKPLFKDGFIEELFRMHEATGAAFYGDIIWLLLILELWSRKYSLAQKLDS